MAKSLEEFFRKYSSNPDLHRAAWEQGDVDWEEYVENPQDYYAANTGSVTGMIYYSDTEAFAQKHEAAIWRALRAFESECGPLDVPAEDDNQLNWLAWFAWENMAGELQSYLEG